MYLFLSCFLSPGGCLLGDPDRRAPPPRFPAEFDAYSFRPLFPWRLTMRLPEMQALSATYGRPAPDLADHCCRRIYEYGAQYGARPPAIMVHMPARLLGGSPASTASDSRQALPRRARSPAWRSVRSRLRWYADGSPLSPIHAAFSDKFQSARVFLADRFSVLFRRVMGARPLRQGHRLIFVRRLLPFALGKKTAFYIRNPRSIPSSFRIVRCIGRSPSLHGAVRPSTSGCRNVEKARTRGRTTSRS